MRFHRFSYRHGEVVATGLGPLGDPWAVWRPVVLARPEWRPPADFYETAEAFILKVEVAGVNEADFDVDLYYDTLIVEGVRVCDVPPGDMRYHAAEVRYGPFRLEVALPSSVDRERVTARYERGFLYVTLPIREAEDS